jgi:Subtilase family
VNVQSGISVRLSKLCAFLPAFVFAWVAGVSAQPIPDEGLAQIQAFIADKAHWTAAEQKLQSTLLYAARVQTQGSMGPGLPASIDGLNAYMASSVASDSTVNVTVRGDVSDDLLNALSAAGGADIRSYPQFERVTLWLPLGSLLQIAQRADVQSIAATAKPRLNRYIKDGQQLAATLLDERVTSRAKPITSIGSVTSQGVLEHGADLAQSTGINGAGVKVCTLSDSADPSAINSLKASGDLPAAGVDVLENQPGNSNEGAAMMEILYDMAPGVSLGFATAYVSDVDFAANIIALQKSPHNCTIIVDDVYYDNEGAFQDGIIAQAINTVTAAGALYFSAAGNSNNLERGTSGTWEGDFVDGGAVSSPITGTGNVHAFAAATPYDTLNERGDELTLQWSDPLGASDNDYDLFVLNPAGTTLVAVSNSAQTGTQDPFEFVFPCCGTSDRIVVVKDTGAAVRAIRVDTFGGKLSIQTDGSTYGHSAAASAYTVAATELGLHVTSQFNGTELNELYSSDGPRKIFYTPAGAAITPGNLLFGSGGGTTLQKVDITAGDCGNTVTFGEFCGTSAAAPHAAAIAALLRQAKPSLTPAQVKTALFSTAIDIEASGFDPTAGNGIVMADRSLRSVLSALTVAKSFVPSSIATGGTSVLTITLSNANAVTLTGVAFTDTYPTGMVNTGTPSPSITGAGCTGSLVASSGGNAIALTSGVIPAVASCTYKVNVTSSTANVYVDTSGAVTTPIGLDTAAHSATLTVGATNTPVLISASSRRVHGAAGTFDLPLSEVLTNPTTEPRQGPAQTIVFTFNKPITSATVSITEGAATAAAPTFSGDDVVVGLTGVTNQQYVTVSLTNASSSDGGSGGSGSVRVGFLVGDVNQNRVVSLADLGLVNAQLAQSVTAANYLKDINASGTLTLADKGITNANLAKALPAP